MSRFSRLGDFALETVFTVCSMYLSGLFGWYLGEGEGGVSYVLAALCACVAFGVARYAFKAGREWGLTGTLRSTWVVIYAGMTLVFALPNAWFDYASAAVVRQSVSVKVDNQNNVAHLAKSEVERLEKRAADLTRRINWRPETTKGEILAPEAYDDLIRSAQLARDNESKRGYCGRICEAKDLELAQLRAGKAMALERNALIAERKQVESELAGARTRSAEHGEHSNPAKASVGAIIGWFHKAGALSENSLYWGANGLQLAITFILQAGMVICGLSHGYHVGRAERESVIIDGGPIVPAPKLIASDTPSEPGSFHEERVTVKTSSGYARMTPSQAVQVAEAGGAIDPSDALKVLRELRTRMQAQHQSLTDNADLFKA